MAGYYQDRDETDDTLPELSLSTSRLALHDFDNDLLEIDSANTDFSIHRSPRASTASISSSRSRRSSVFSAASKGTAASSAPSIAPSNASSHWTTLTQHQLHQHLQHPIDPLLMADVEVLIPCEFGPLTGCTTIFSAFDNMTEVANHVGDAHLNWDYPLATRCWWCDDYQFRIDQPDGAYGMFINRMEHIKSHIVDEGYSCSRFPPREDFDMLEHVYRLRLISREVFEQKKGRKEVPCPEGVYPAGFKRPVPEREHMTSYDNSREDRMRNREMRERGKTKERMFSRRAR